MNKIQIEQFLDQEYSQSALYSSFRSIANYIDGMKPSSRKIIYTIKKKNIKNEVKVSRLAADCSSETQYIHGEGSLEGVIVNLAQNYVGANNKNLLEPCGSFGNRFIPIPSASRYIFTKKSENFDSLFHESDIPILISQTFEGQTIEPRFYVPILPLLLINGSEGIGTGFAQKILPRNEKEIIEYIKYKLSGKTYTKDIMPYYKGFNGLIEKGEELNAWIIKGTYKKINSTTIEVTEIPIGYTLASYNKILNKLVDNKEIHSYEDLSEDDNFKFILKVSRSFGQLSEEKLLDKLRLIKRVTENLTCVDEHNKIIEFKSVQEILDNYVDIRLEYYKKRKEFLFNKYKEELSVLDSKALFIKNVIEGNIIVNNKPKKDIEKQIEKMEKIIKVESSYDYLLNMPIYSLTKEKYEELIKKVKEKKNIISELRKKSENDLWKEDLKLV